MYLNVSKDEGHLTKLRASIVKKESLSRFARKIKLHEKVKVGNCENAKKESVLADAFEALIAAIYLDGGIEPAKKFVLNNMDKYIDDALKGKILLDYKTHLQELIQNDKNSKIRYEIVREEGPDHCKVFYTHVFVNEKLVGKGSGKSKKESEQAAAKKALEGELCI